MHSSRMRTARSSSRPGGVSTRHPISQTRPAPQEQTPPKTRHPPGPDTPPVNRMTNRCKKITLPQTSFAGDGISVRALNLSDISLEFVGHCSRTSVKEGEGGHNTRRVHLVTASQYRNRNMVLTANKDRSI